MSAQRLGAKKIRMLARKTGLPITRGWSHGTYTLYFAFSEDGWKTHQHGRYDLKTGEWELESEDRTVHYSSCLQAEWKS